MHYVDNIKDIVINNNSVVIVGLTGAKGVGKSTLAQQLVEEMPKDNIQAFVMSFADPVKEVVNKMIFESSEHPPQLQGGVGTPQIIECNAQLRKLHEDIKEDVNKGGDFDKERCRPYYQQFGDIMRNFNPNYFVEEVRSKIEMINSLVKKTSDKKTLIVIDDVRYPNEASICSVVLQLMRDGVEYTHEHSSETPLSSELTTAIVHLNDIKK